MRGKRQAHPIREIEAALLELERIGWKVEKAKGRSAHSWGFAMCPANARKECRGGVFCRMSVWSTPRSPERHARNLLRQAQGCVKQAYEADDE